MSKKVTSLTFDLFGRDKTASKAMRGVGDQAGRTGESLRRAGVAIGAGLAVAAGAAIAFGVDSVKAFAEAEQAQQKLNFAFEKFPALADVGIESLRRLNSALALKTRFDDDAIASGQAVLAQFGLTGNQLKKLTPLLLDYAGQTGKDLPSAAEDLGRALLGQGRALKGIGIEFADTGSLAGNFDQLIQDLSGTVGGFAEKDAQTAAGKLDLLANRFGEVQEAVGEALMPALDRLLEWVEGDGLAGLEGFAEWFASDGVDAIQGFVDQLAKLSKEGTLVPTVVGGLAAITVAQVGLNAAMALNPVGLVVLALAALIGQFTFAISHLEEFKVNAKDTSWGLPFKVMLGGWFGLIAFFAQNWNMTWFVISSGFTVYINYIIILINGLLSPLQSILDVINAISGTHLSVRIGQLALPRLPRTHSTQTSVDTSQMGGFRAMAAGGIVRPTPGGTHALIGEAGQAEAVIPLSREGLAKYGIGGGGDIHVHLAGVYAGDKDSLARTLVSTIRDAQRSGAIGRTQFA